MSLSEDLLVKQLAHLPRAMQLTTNAANLALLFCSFPNQLCCHFKSFHKRSIQYNGEDGIIPLCIKEETNFIIHDRCLLWEENVLN